jgi:hypothetical protein
MDEDLYELKPDQKERYAGIYLLDYMVRTPTGFPVWLEGKDVDLEPVLEWMLTHDYVEIVDQKAYAPSQNGRKVLKQFDLRYRDFLSNYDIYGAVDLETGTFAFASYHEFETDADFHEYLEDDRWEDLRVAVAEYNGVDPIEIVFMSFLNEGRFGRDENGWQFDLLLGSVWDEILEICNTAIDVDDLSWEDEQGAVSGEDVIRDIVSQGSALVEELHLKEKHDAPTINPWMN